MSKRPETGTMRFDTDWRGVFIRGDDAWVFVRALEEILPSINEDQFYVKAELMQLLNLLKNADERSKTITQQLKIFDECIK